MKTKEELIKLGMYSNRRIDTVYILGNIYDLLPELHTKEQVIEKIEEIREYLNQHREIINNYEGDIVLSKSILNALEQDFNINYKREKSKIMTKEDYPNLDKTGIYGIYIENELIYIGKTTTSFRQRFYGYRTRIKNIDTMENNNKNFYKALKEAKDNGKNVRMIPLIVIEDLEVKGHNKFTYTDIKMMELALITTLKPKYNIEGVYIPYDFSHK